MLFDTHAHLDDRAFDSDREALISGLREKGIALVMNPGCSLESSKNAVALAKKFPFLYAAVGSHPDAADEVDEAVLEGYRLLCREEKVKAIGEIGLDYHYEDIPREIQKKAFRMQMALAQEVGLPVIIHQREALADCLEILGDFPQVKGVFHCFSGSAQTARELTAQGWYVGFTGVLTFKNARKALEAAQAVPRDRIVLETDCPYMAPEPFRGRRNDPGYLYRMAEVLGALLEITPEEAQELTLQNGKRLYGIE